MEKIKKIIKEELKKYFQTHKYSLLDETLITNEILIGELLDPNDSYQYTEEKGYYEYKDISGDVFFVRLHYIPTPGVDTKNGLTGGIMELKTGWINEQGKAQYEPSVPPHSKNSSAIYVNKRSDTVAKIYRDEILPFFEKQNLTKIMVIRPISTSRMKFAERLVKKFTPIDKFDIEYGSPLIIEKK
jgi:hypothetical protein